MSCNAVVILCYSRRVEWWFALNTPIRQVVNYSIDSTIELTETIHTLIARQSCDRVCGMTFSGYYSNRSARADEQRISSSHELDTIVAPSVSRLGVPSIALRSVVFGSIVFRSIGRYSIALTNARRQSRPHRPRPPARRPHRPRRPAATRVHACRPLPHSASTRSWITPSASQTSFPPRGERYHRASSPTRSGVHVDPP